MTWLPARHKLPIVRTGDSSRAIDKPCSCRNNF
jgi:hypothetical protein